MNSANLTRLYNLKEAELPVKQMPASSHFSLLIDQPCQRFIPSLKLKFKKGQLF